MSFGVKLADRRDARLAQAEKSPERDEHASSDCCIKRVLVVEADVERVQVEEGDWAACLALTVLGCVEVGRLHRSTEPLSSCPRPSPHLSPGLDGTDVVVYRRACVRSAHRSDERAHGCLRWRVPERVWHAALVAEQLVLGETGSVSSTRFPCDGLEHERLGLFLVLECQERVVWRLERRNPDRQSIMCWYVWAFGEAGVFRWGVLRRASEVQP